MMTDNVDEFMLRMMNGYKGKPFKSVTDNDVNVQSEDEKKAMSEKQAEHRELLDAVKDALGGSVKEVRLSSRLADSPAALTSDGPLSLGMEKVLSEMPLGGEAKADRILELNPDHPVFAALIRAKEQGGEQLKNFAMLLYNQALMMAGLKIDDPAGFAAAINALITK